MNAPNSICLLRLSALGDVCHCISTVRAIQRQWPDARLTWIIGKGEYRLVRDLPGVEFVVYDKRGGIGAFLELRRNLRRRFDCRGHQRHRENCRRRSKKWNRFCGRRARKVACSAKPSRVAI